MAKFCTRCGRKLEEGEVCNCEATVSVQTNDTVQNLTDIIKGIFVKPIDTIKKYTNEKYFSLALILIAILGVAAGLLAMAIVKNAYSLVLGSMGLGTYSSLMGSYQAQIPYAEIFFGTLIAVIVLAFVYTGLLYLVNSVIFKGEKSFKKVFSMYGVASSITSAVTLLSAILMFMNVYLGIVVFLLGSVLNMVYTYHGLKYLGEKDANKYGYIYLLTMVFNFIAMFIIAKIFS